MLSREIFFGTKKLWAYTPYIVSVLQSYIGLDRLPYIQNRQTSAPCCVSINQIRQVDVVRMSVRDRSRVSRCPEFSTIRSRTVLDLLLGSALDKVR